MRARFEWPTLGKMNIAALCCDDWAVHSPDKIAIRHIAQNGVETAHSYGALKAQSDGLAQVMRAGGLRPGDRVAILLPQCPQVVIAHFAAMKCGTISVPLFTLFGPDALRYRLADSGAQVLITDDDNRAKIDAMRADLPDLTTILCVNGEVWRKALSEDGADFVPAPTSADDPAMIIYTSGTTGPPKGVLHAHRFLIGHLPSMECHHEGFPQPGDCGWTPADWAWIGGLMDMALPCLYYGVPLISHRMRKFDPAQAWDLIARLGVRNAFLPPTALKMMASVPVPQGANLRSIGSGGESLGSDLLAWGRDVVGASINEIYGQTECNLTVATCAALGATPQGAMGRAVPGTTLAILGADGTPAAPGALGEICIRRGHPAMFLRYWNKPEQTAAKFNGDWMRTGDLGRMDSDGFVTFVARDDDVITTSGYRVGPSEIEHCLRGDPDVAMAAVVGVPDAARTEIVHAFVVLKDGAQWDGAEARLIARAASCLDRSRTHHATAF